MAESKVDYSQLIGFLFLMAAFVSFLFISPPSEEEIDIQVEENIPINDSFNANQDSGLNAAEFSENIVKIEEESFIVENENVILKFSNKGAKISELTLKDYNDSSGNRIRLLKNNQSLGLSFFNINGVRFDSNTVMFNYKSFDNQNSKVVEFEYLNNLGGKILYRYVIPNQGYLLNFEIETQGLNNIVGTNRKMDLVWDLDSRRQSKSVDYENRYTYINYKDQDGKIRDMSAYSEDDEVGEVKWLSYSQHFFNSILIFNDVKSEVDMKSTNMDLDYSTQKYSNSVDDEGKQIYLKTFNTRIPIDISRSNEISESMGWYIGPNDYYVLKNYKDGISESIWFGWGIFGWINRNIFFPLYQFLSSFLSAGIAIIIMVILTRLIMSPVQYKMYLSQAKMKILRPEISAATEKFKDDPLKRNQETMRIYNQAGANPLSGCLPMFIQLPVFYALFCFFPVAFALRGESFLWADDLSVYDSILELPFYIPLYGDHVSLFPILAGVTMFFYTSVSGNQQMQPTQPGMPNMKFIMYFLPFTLMIFFNNFASGLSLYYTISNLLTIVIIYAIKNFIIDEKKILLKIEENKKKPKGEGRFQRRLRKLQEMAEKAENQRKNNR